jgi:hypothetical protein
MYRNIPFMSDLPPGEPKGWRELQAKAQKETDSGKLDKLIKRMNELLTKQEQQAKDRLK